MFIVFFCTDPERFGFDSKLLERCRKYLDDSKNYRDIKNTLEHISRTRKMV